MSNVNFIESVIELPAQPCAYGNTVRDGNGKHVPCGVKVDWFDGDSPDFLYCGQCQTDFAAELEHERLEESREA